MPPGEVTLATVGPRRTAVVRRPTSWNEFPSLWGRLLDEVYAGLESAGLRHTQPWRNVMLYEDDVPNVEVGVLIDRPFPAAGEVVESHLPGGAVATVIHRGPYSELDAAHAAVHGFCRAGGIDLAGPRCEIYGHWHDDPAKLETAVHYLLAASSVIHSP